MVLILFAAFLSGVVLYVIGSIMERNELAERERHGRERNGSGLAERRR